MSKVTCQSQYTVIQCSIVDIMSCFDLVSSCDMTWPTSALWPVEHITLHSSQRINTNNSTKHFFFQMYKTLESPTHPPSNTVIVMQKKKSSKAVTDSSCAGPSPILQLSFQWLMDSAKIKSRIFDRVWSPTSPWIFTVHTAEAGQGAVRKKQWNQEFNSKWQ